MTEFVTMLKNYVNFKDRTTKRGYWMAFLFLFIALIIVSVIDTLVGANMIIYGIFCLAMILPALGMQVRRLRDAGLAWTNIFWGLLPLIGTIILIIKLCKPSVADDGTPVV